jgi:taurine dioxygenase
LRDAVRLGFRNSAGPFRSFGRIAVEPRPYQLVPLLMALKLDPVRLLIADDVGIGKTVEALLIARELPPKGGDTLFASGYAAYEALSPGLKETLSTLKAANCSAKAEVTKTREDRVADSATDKSNQALVGEHPVIRTHPETGRRTLYVNPAHTTHFVGWTEQESQPLLDFLFAHQVKPEFTCRFSWQPGSIALWDNRCVLHNPINDYHGHKRLLHRITLKGDVPV